MLQEVKKVGQCPCLIEWEPFGRGTGFSAETHVCGSSVQNDIAKERKKEKDSLLRGGKPIQNKDEAFSRTGLLGKADFLPGIACPSLCLHCVPSPVCSASNMFCLQQVPSPLQKLTNCLKLYYKGLGYQKRKKCKWKKVQGTPSSVSLSNF